MSTRRPAVVQAVIADLFADSALMTALGGQRIYPRSASRTVEYPSVEWFTFSERETENMGPFRMRLAIYARSQSEADTIEGRIRAVLHRDVRRQFAGVDCATLYVTTDEIEHEDPGIEARSVEFYFEPVRAR